MSEIVIDWLHYDNRLPKRKRAELVCSSCHSKKVKCDLQTQTQAREEQGHTGHGTCSNCFSAGRDCVVYISKRKRHHSATGGTDPTTVGPSSFSNGGNGTTTTLRTTNGNHDALPTAPPTFHAPRSPSETEENNTTTILQPPPPPSITTQPIFSSTTSALQHLESLSSSAAGIAPLTSSVVPRTSAHTTTPQSQSHLSDTHLPGPGPGAATSRSNPTDVDTGFLQVYQVENQIDAERQELEAAAEFFPSSTSILPPGGSGSGGDNNNTNSAADGLTQIFAETYLEYCYPWCPTLDIPSIPLDTQRSPLLSNALALAASHIRPPLIPHDGPKTYYRRATSIFYNDEEPDGLTTLQAISLFYWWAPRSPALARRHSSWWWTSVLIRHAQQMNFHREPGPNHPLLDVLQLGLRRRIWWTAFARERLTALCQSKPCIIDPEDCNIRELTLSDFPPDPRLQRKGEIFIHWVRLCAIIGRVAKTLSRSSFSSTPTTREEQDCHQKGNTTNDMTASLRAELISWITSLPDHLHLPISTSRTETGTFDRDIHQLHLPYLTTIIILHLRRSTTSSDLPQALPPAILAASCIVRIMRDILSRGDTRFLMPITCWYSGTAFIALLQAVRIREIAGDANEGLDVLTGMVEQLKGMWGSANVVREGFDRLRRAHAGDHSLCSSSFSASFTPAAGRHHLRSGSRPTTVLPTESDGMILIPAPTTTTTCPGPGPGSAGQDKDSKPNNQDQDPDPDAHADRQESESESESESPWPALFPFVTRQTSRIASVLLPGTEPGIPPTRFPSPDNLLFHETFIQDYQGFFDPFDPYLGFGDVVNGIL